MNKGVIVMFIRNEHKNMLLWIFFLILLFFVFSLLYKLSFVRTVDVWVMENIVTIHHPVSNTIFIDITNFASRPYQYGIFIIFSGICLLIKRKWKEPLMLGVCLFGIRYANQLFKNVFERVRPAYHPVIEIGGYSFPSGHAMISIAFFGLLTYLSVHTFPGLKPYKTILYCVVAAFISLVGFSRVYLGVHYPTDVLAGFLAGGAWLILSISLYKILFHVERY